MTELSDLKSVTLNWLSLVTIEFGFDVVWLRLVTFETTYFARTKY